MNAQSHNLVKGLWHWSVALVFLVFSGLALAQTNTPNVVDPTAGSLPLAQVSPTNVGSLPAIPGLPGDRSMAVA